MEDPGEVMRLTSSNSVFKYASMTDADDVLLVQKGADGLLYTTGPQQKTIKEQQVYNKHLSDALSSNSEGEFDNKEMLMGDRNQKVSFIK